MRLILICACLSASACSSEALSDYMDDDVPAGQCEDTDASQCETGGQGDECNSTETCAGDLVCAATFNGDIGTFECQSACIETMQEDGWCTDAASCCDVGAVCGMRGYCMLPDGVDTGIDTGSDDATTGGITSSTETGTGTGTDSTSTDSGTSTETDTSTDSGTSESGTSTGVTSG